MLSESYRLCEIFDFIILYIFVNLVSSVGFFERNFDFLPEQKYFI